MPAMITHFCLANRVLKYYDNGFDRDSFLLGAQGPDLLFFFRAYPWLRGENGLPIGNALHDVRPSVLFDIMADIVRNAPEEYCKLLRSYVCGFFCHYAADRTFHPFVCSRQHELKNRYPHFSRDDEPYHYRYESALDTWMVRLEFGESVKRFVLRDVIPPSEPTRDKALAFFYHRLLARVLDKDIPETLLHKLTADMRHSMMLMRDRFGIKRAVFRTIETMTRRGAWYSSLIRTDHIDDFDYLNKKQTPWEWNGITCFSTAEDLRSEAIVLAISLITQYQCGTGGFTLTHDIDFKGCYYTKKEGALTMNRIASFEIDHTTLQKGVYLSREDGDVRTWDIRFILPNKPPFLEMPAVHTIEHLFATFVRNSAFSERIIYFGPMGCRTGFYFLTRNIADEQVLALIKDTLLFIAEYNGDIPGASAVECGNWKEHDLDGAKRYAADMVDVLRTKTVADMRYK